MKSRSLAIVCVCAVTIAALGGCVSNGADDGRVRVRAGATLIPGEWTGEYQEYRVILDESVAHLDGVANLMLVRSASSGPHPGGSGGQYVPGMTEYRHRVASPLDAGHTAVILFDRNGNYRPDDGEMTLRPATNRWWQEPTRFEGPVVTYHPAPRPATSPAPLSDAPETPEPPAEAPTKKVSSQDASAGSAASRPSTSPERTVAATSPRAQRVTIDGAPVVRITVTAVPIDAWFANAAVLFEVIGDGRVVRASESILLSDGILDGDALVFEFRNGADLDYVRSDAGIAITWDANHNGLADETEVSFVPRLNQSPPLEDGVVMPILGSSAGRHATVVELTDPSYPFFQIVDHSGRRTVWMVRDADLAEESLLPSWRGGATFGLTPTGDVQYVLITGERYGLPNGIRVGATESAVGSVTPGHLMAEGQTRDGLRWVRYEGLPGYPFVIVVLQPADGNFAVARFGCAWTPEDAALLESALMEAPAEG